MNTVCNSFEISRWISTTRMSMIEFWVWKSPDIQIYWRSDLLNIERIFLLESCIRAICSFDIFKTFGNLKSNFWFLAMFWCENRTVEMIKLEDVSFRNFIWNHNFAKGYNWNRIENKFQNFTTCLIYLFGKKLGIIPKHKA